MYCKWGIFTYNYNAMRTQFNLTCFNLIVFIPVYLYSELTFPKISFFSKLKKCLGNYWVLFLTVVPSQGLRHHWVLWKISSGATRMIEIDAFISIKYYWVAAKLFFKKASVPRIKKGWEPLLHKYEIKMKTKFEIEGEGIICSLCLSKS